MADYAHPESLVSTDWVVEHGSDANVRLVEVDVDTSAYDSGHIAGRLVGTGSPSSRTRSAGI